MNDNLQYDKNSAGVSVNVLNGEGGVHAGRVTVQEGGKDMSVPSIQCC